MKLTRNAEGNWSYQYVANQEDVKQKQQELLDASIEMISKIKEAMEPSKISNTMGELFDFSAFACVG